MQRISMCLDHCKQMISKYAIINTLSLCKPLEFTYCLWNTHLFYFFIKFAPQHLKQCSSALLASFLEAKGFTPFL